MPNTIPAAGEAMPVEVQSPKMRIDALLEEAAKIIRDTPDLMIDHVTANKRGVYTSLTIPGTEEHPWTKARRLMKELSATLDDCDDATWFAHVMPPRPPVFNAFGAYPMGQKPDELPIDHIERLSWELSEALNGYQHGQFQAVVLPSASAGHTVMLTKIGVFDLRAKA
ncbi:hypothetical protein [Agrobacterium radiobacter]|uniref:hypothetical protein n=1 Tax=Agrobacterium radiobacter TaxID=362 RepID=UPI001605F7F2|nr:hypothetical protein [Agrobacterium radiobacter]MBB4407070.1 hypothetical protein [Agrobacterium radiobacter]MBB4452726.1 hypothetical protein [Agrobacterium radiobacter]